MKRLWPLLFLLVSSCAGILSGPSPEQQRQIYQKVAAEIDESRQRGDTFLRDGDYYQALASYRQAAFFHPSPALTGKIRELETKITEESDTLYARGRGYLPRDHSAALLAFNQALLLNPEHRQARQARDQLLRAPGIAEELQARQTALQSTWADQSGRRRNITALAPQVEALLALRHDHPLAREIQQYIIRERRENALPYLVKSRESLAAGQLPQARLLARKARAIDPEDREVRALLREIQQRQDLAYFINLSRFRLQKNDYDKAEEFARQALALAPGHQETTTLLSRIHQARLEHSLEQLRRFFAAGDYEEATLLLHRVMADGPLIEQWQELRESIEKILAVEMPRMLAEGQKLFNENKLTEAGRVLACLLDLDPDNSMAATYLSKIQNRLRTLRSLR